MVTNIVEVTAKLSSAIKIVDTILITYEGEDKLKLRRKLIQQVFDALEVEPIKKERKKVGF